MFLEQSSIATTPNMLIDRNDLRAQFCSALSHMYKEEVPLYEDLVELVDEINDNVTSDMFNGDRIRVERHGAIRLGKPAELAMLARLFRQMDMYPVGYYDLSSAGLPVHATAFRPITLEGLAKNPFRIFTSLLRPELIPAEIRAEALAILDDREIFPRRLVELVNKAEAQGGVTVDEGPELIQNALRVFKWHDTAQVSRDTYERMKQCHPLLADIAGFKGPHINHLTPRVLNIDKAQKMMAERGITPKIVIEGPPKRQCPILLRQTSFQALSEPVRFPDESSVAVHRARFGEIELRGCALTPKGHNLYLRLLADNNANSPTDDNEKHQRRLEKTFVQFPDDWETLRKEKLAYFHYKRRTNEPLTGSLDQLLSSGVLEYQPIEYEDFLPASAAGIFHSNLGGAVSNGVGLGQRDQFEGYLGQPVHDYFELYASIQADSLAKV